MLQAIGALGDDRIGRAALDLAVAQLRSGAESEGMVVHDALAALRDKERDILQMAYWDELSTAEIAGVLGCSESAAKVRLHRARAAFRKQMPVTAGSITQRMGA